MTAIASTTIQPQPLPAPTPSRRAQPPAQQATMRVGGPLTRGEIEAAAWSHFGPALALAVGVALWPVALLVIGIPLYFRLTVGRQSRYVREQSTAALNFVVTTLVGLGAALLVLLASGTAAGLFALAPILAFFVLQIALLLRAGRAAKRGKRYRYPLSLHILR